MFSFGVIVERTVVSLVLTVVVEAYQRFQELLTVLKHFK
jgi:hypothetical protein